MSRFWLLQYNTPKQPVNEQISGPDLSWYDVYTVMYVCMCMHVLSNVNQLSINQEEMT